MYAMAAASQAPEHRTSIRQIDRLPDHVMIQLNHCVTPQHDRLRFLPRDRLSLALREGPYLFDRWTVRLQPFIKGWVFDVERDAQ